MYKSPQKPQILEFEWPGTPNSQVFDFNINILQQTTNFASISQNTTIVLPPGHYYCIAYPDFTRSAASHNNAVYWHLNNTQIGNIGGSDHYQSNNTDNPEASFTLTQTGNLNLRQTQWFGSGTSLAFTNDSRGLIMRVVI